MNRVVLQRDDVSSYCTSRLLKKVTFCLSYSFVLSFIQNCWLGLLGRNGGEVGGLRWLAGWLVTWDGRYLCIFVSLYMRRLACVNVAFGARADSSLWGRAARA